MLSAGPVSKLLKMSGLPDADLGTIWKKVKVRVEPGLHDAPYRFFF